LLVLPVKPSLHIENRLQRRFSVFCEDPPDSERLFPLYFLKIIEKNQAKWYSKEKPNKENLL